MAGQSFGALIAILVLIVATALMPGQILLENLSDFGETLFLGLGADPVGR